MSSIETLRAGDWVEVKSPLEIAESLDVNGALDGLPFMPEMMQYCGRQFRVLRHAEKTCVEFKTRYWIREFHGNDVVLLEGLRCSGNDHGSCQRMCTLFWKTAWLRRLQKEQAVTEPRESGAEALRMKLKVISGPGRYFCQSTELVKATRPLTKARILVLCFRDLRSRSRGIGEMARLIAMPLWRKVTSRIPRRRLTGDLKRTPVGDLKLQPGEWVQIKTSAEIARTLDVHGRNRGLVCDHGMCEYSGGRYRVMNRLDRMIAEPTGEMREVDATVILEGLNCGCGNVVGGCPRQDFIYWREVWLSRTE